MLTRHRHCPSSPSKVKYHTASPHQQHGGLLWRQAASSVRRRRRRHVMSCHPVIPLSSSPSGGGMSPSLSHVHVSDPLATAPERRPESRRRDSLVCIAAAPSHQQSGPVYSAGLVQSKQPCRSLGRYCTYSRAGTCLPSAFLSPLCFLCSKIPYLATVPAPGPPQVPWRPSQLPHLLSPGFPLLGM